MTTRLDEPIDISQVSQGVEATEMPFDFAREDFTWKKYGMTEAPLLIRAEDDTLYDDNKLKGLFKYKVIDGKLKRIFRKTANRGYVVFPNEECDLVVDKVISEDSEFGLKLHKVHTAYNGDAKYWEIRSAKKYRVESGDEVQLGIVVRNSLACNVSFGADIFTFRLVCQNGAISKGKDLLSLKIPHYGKGALVLMQEALSKRIRDLFKEGEYLLDQYRIAAKLKIRQETAEAIAKKISQKYIPDYIELEDHKVKLHKTPTVWKTFNDITEEIWHNNSLSFLTKADMTNAMHSVMKQEILVSRT